MSEGNVAADQLRLLIERIERLEEEKKGIQDDINMKEALARISQISDELINSYYPGREYIETLNIATLAVDILKAALARRESVGAHYRED